MHLRQAARAARLSAWGGQARRLALRLWSSDTGLDVGTTEQVVAAMLSEPHRRPGDVQSEMGPSLPVAEYGRKGDRWVQFFEMTHASRVRR
jgi:hypothetical protein